MTSDAESELDKYRKALEQIESEDWKMSGNKVYRGRFGQLAHDALADEEVHGSFIDRAFDQVTE